MSNEFQLIISSQKGGVGGGGGRRKSRRCTLCEQKRTCAIFFYFFFLVCEHACLLFRIKLNGSVIRPLSFLFAFKASFWILGFWFILGGLFCFVLGWGFFVFVCLFFVCLGFFLACLLYMGFFVTRSLFISFRFNFTFKSDKKTSKAKPLF